MHHAAMKPVPPVTRTSFYSLVMIADLRKCIFKKEIGCRGNREAFAEIDVFILSH